MSLTVLNCTRVKHYSSPSGQVGSGQVAAPPRLRPCYLLRVHGVTCLSNLRHLSLFQEEEGCQIATPAGGPGKKPPRPFSLTSNNSLSLLSPSADTSFKPPPNTGWGSTIGSFLSARALKFQLTPSNTPTTARPSDSSSTFPHVAPPTIHEQFGEAEGLPLFNVAVTPATSPSAGASIDAVISSGAWTKSVEVSSKENGVIKHDVLSDLR